MPKLCLFLVLPCTLQIPIIFSALDVKDGPIISCWKHLEGFLRNVLWYGNVQLGKLISGWGWVIQPSIFYCCLSCTQGCWSAWAYHRWAAQGLKAVQHPGQATRATSKRTGGQLVMSCCRALWKNWLVAWQIQFSVCMSQLLQMFKCVSISLLLIHYFLSDFRGKKKNPCRWNFPMLSPSICSEEYCKMENQPSISFIIKQAHQYNHYQSICNT